MVVIFIIIGFLVGILLGYIISKNEIIEDSIASKFGNEEVEIFGRNLKIVLKVINISKDK